jgi:hypothetical protein
MSVEIEEPDEGLPIYPAVKVKKSSLIAAIDPVMYVGDQMKAAGVSNLELYEELTSAANNRYIGRELFFEIVGKWVDII